jgi:hypothetical protein
MREHGMSGGDAPLLTLALRDGGELRITRDGISIGDRFVELGRLQDARQVAPDPVTIALRVAGAGLIEFRPARPEDGALALEAIFRLRPELRPAGFEPAPSTALPNLPPPPAAGYTVPPYGPTAGMGYPPYGPAPGGYVPPAGYPVPPVAVPGYGAHPNLLQGELTPYPRRIGEILSAIFQLYTKHFRRWLALGFWVVALPTALLGALQIGLDRALGLDALASSMQWTTTLSGNTSGCALTLPAGFQQDLPLLLISSGVTTLLSLVTGAWSTAAFAHAGREAVLGRPVQTGASLRTGARRLLPVLVASVIVSLVWVLLLAPALVSLGISLYGLAQYNLCDPASMPSGATVYAGLDCLGLLLLIPGVAGALFFAIRLLFASYIAATEPLGVGAALRKSWQLTRGSWWRIFGVILAVIVPVGIIGGLATSIGSGDTLITLVVVAPLAQLLLVPLIQLAYVTVLYDLRLRKEGFATLRPPAGVPTGEPGDSSQQG